MNDAWIADRMRHIEASGIRKAFEMSKSMVDPINLSIGLPDFDVADPVKAVAIEATPPRTASAMPRPKETDRWRSNEDMAHFL